MADVFVKHGLGLAGVSVFFIWLLPLHLFRCLRIYLLFVSLVDSNLVFCLGALAPFSHQNKIFQPIIFSPHGQENMKNLVN